MIVKLNDNGNGSDRHIEAEYANEVTDENLIDEGEHRLSVLFAKDLNFRVIRDYQFRAIWNVYFHIKWNRKVRGNR